MSMHDKKEKKKEALLININFLLRNGNIMSQSQEMDLLKHIASLNTRPNLK